MAVLHCQPFYGKHTAVNIEKAWGDMMENWAIDKNRCHAVVSDSAANMRRTFQDLTLERAPCFAHSIQLALKDGLLAQRVVIDTTAVVRGLVGHFKHSSSATDRLHEIQNELQLPMHKLIQDVTTRWSSTFNMLERVLEQRRAIIVYGSDENDKNVKLPTANQWQVIEKMVVLLRQFARLTESSCRGDASISSVLPSLAALNYFLSTDETIASMSGVNTMRSELVSALENRFRGWRDTLLFTIATALDPRHKLRFFNCNESLVVKKAILQLLPKPIVPESETDVITDDDAPPPAKKAILGYWDCYDLASTANNPATGGPGQ
jgi:hypothetical protein